MKKNLLIIGLAFAVALSCARTSWAEDAAKSTAPAATKISAEKLAALKTKYPNRMTVPGTAVQINLPDGWKVKDLGSLKLLMGPTPGQNINVVKVTLGPQEKKLAMDEMARKVGDAMAQAGIVDEVLEVNGPLEIDGCQAAGLSTKKETPKITMMQIQYMIRRGSEAFIVTFTTPIADAETFKAMVSDVAWTIELPPVPPPDKNAAAFKAELQKRVPEMIAVVEAGDFDKTIAELMPPKELEEFKKEPDFEQNKKEFQEQKAAILINTLKALDYDQMQVNGDSVIFPSGDYPVRFVKVDGKWYISDKNPSAPPKPQPRSQAKPATAP